MRKVNIENVSWFNERMQFEDPDEIIKFSLSFAERPVVTTSFGPFSGALLHLCSGIDASVPVIWCDTGFNTTSTYEFVQHLTEKYSLNLDIFSPKYTTAYIHTTLGVPEINNPKHVQFSNIVKLEPFQRAFNKYRPDVWFTNIRKQQTDYRKNLGIFSFSKKGVLKVSPFYHYSDDEIKSYIKENKIPMENDYFDPVKSLAHRECGIHLKF